MGHHLWRKPRPNPTQPPRSKDALLRAHVWPLVSGATSLPLEGPARPFPPQDALDNPFAYTEDNLVVMQSKKTILDILNAFLDQYEEGTVELLMANFKEKVTLTGPDKYTEKENAAMQHLLWFMEETLDKKALDSRSRSNSYIKDPR